MTLLGFKTILHKKCRSGKNSEGPAENSWLLDLCPAKWKQISKSVHVLKFWNFMKTEIFLTFWKFHHFEIFWKFWNLMKILNFFEILGKFWNNFFFGRFKYSYDFLLSSYVALSCNLINTAHIYNLYLV
jgi:hypothetical protein